MISEPITPGTPEAGCGRCGFPAPQEARFCRRCGEPRQIPASDAPPATAAPPEVVAPAARVAAFTPTRGSRTSHTDARDRTPEPEARAFGVGSLAPPETYPTSAGLAVPRPKNPIIVDPAELSPRSIRCACGHVMSTAARFCARCGTRRRGRIWHPTVGAPGSKLSAQRTLSRHQTRFFLAAASLVGVLLFVVPFATLTVAIALATALYLAALVYRLLMFRTSLDAPEMIVIDEADARAIPDEELPIYTILVPAYREPEVIAQLMTSLRQLDYPADRLDIKLLLEADDPDTLAAVLEARPSANVDVLRLLPSEPRTKPKACNVGLGRARGSFVTIYDAEDRPDPLQLRRAVAAFKRSPPEMACLQAKLSYHNAEQNLLTRWFTAEYALWFGQLLPGLVKLGAPVPLGEPRIISGEMSSCGLVDGIRSTSRKTPTWASGFTGLASGQACWIPRPWRKRTATSSTGRSSGHAGTRATCRRGSSTCAIRANCGANSDPRVFSDSICSSGARRSWR